MHIENITEVPHDLNPKLEHLSLLGFSELWVKRGSMACRLGGTPTVAWMPWEPVLLHIPLPAALPQKRPKMTWTLKVKGPGI